MRRWFSYKQRSPVARIAINMRPQKGPWGGSNPFVLQLQAFLESRGYQVSYKLNGQIDAIILIDPREDLINKAFGLEEIRQYKRINPDVVVIHRINECDQRKATSFMDECLQKANEFANFTVFISKWLLEYHSEKWFDQNLPHTVIYNGADPRIFHPFGQQLPGPSEPFRLVTHHWSNNELKGFSVYRELDSLIKSQTLRDTELWVIGRWPDDTEWSSARTFGPATGHDLADKLRRCHAYVTASLWEPCGMHHVEGAQCGLPLLYHIDGGGIVEAGEKYGIGFSGDVRGAVEEMRAEYGNMRNRLLKNMPSGDRMCLDYAEVLQNRICLRRNDT